MGALRRPVKKTKPAKKSSISDEERALFLSAVEFSESDWVFIKEKYEPVKQATVKKSVSLWGYDAKLDLHGLTRDKALARLDAFLSRCRYLLKLRALIVHGKGTGALREAVRHFLGVDKRVIEVKVPPAKLGEEGAIWVQLKR